MKFRYYSLALMSIAAIAAAQTPGQPQGGWRRATPEDLASQQEQARPPVEGTAVQDEQQQPPPPPPPGRQGPDDGWRRFGDNRGMMQSSQPVPPQLTVAPGAWITVRINQEISSDRNQPGDTFTATLAQPLVANGYVIARRGQTVIGRVSEVRKAGHVKGVSSLGIELTEIGIADGQQVPVKTQLVQRQGETSHGNDAVAIGTTTGIGAAIGAAVDGGFGAGMGAIGGAVVSTIGVLSTRGRATVVYPEMVLTFRLESPITVSTVGREMAYQPVRQEDYDSQQHALRQRPPVRPGPYYGPSLSPYPYYSPYSYGSFWGPSFYFYSGPRFYGHRYGRRW